MSKQLWEMAVSRYIALSDEKAKSACWELYSRLSGRKAFDGRALMEAVDSIEVLIAAEPSMDTIEYDEILAVQDAMEKVSRP